MIRINPEIIHVAPAVKMDLGKQEERSPFKSQDTSPRSSGALRVESKQQGRAEVPHKALHSWSRAVAPAHLCTLCFHRALPASWEGQEQASTVPGHRLSTDAPAPTFIL